MDKEPVLAAIGAVMILILPWILLVWLIVHPSSAMKFEAKIVRESEVPGAMPGDFMNAMIISVLVQSIVYCFCILFYRYQSEEFVKIVQSLN